MEATWIYLGAILSVISAAALITRLSRGVKLSMADLTIGVVALPTLWVIGLIQIVGFLGGALFARLEQIPLELEREKEVEQKKSRRR